MYNNFVMNNIYVLYYVYFKEVYVYMYLWLFDIWYENINSCREDIIFF